MATNELWNTLDERYNHAKRYFQQLERDVIIWEQSYQDSKMEILQYYNYPTVDEIFNKRIFLLSKPTSLERVQKAYARFQSLSNEYHHKHEFDIAPFLDSKTIIKVFNDEQNDTWNGAQKYWFAFKPDGTVEWFDESGFSSNISPRRDFCAYRLDEGMYRSPNWTLKLEGALRRASVLYNEMITIASHM